MIPATVYIADNDVHVRRDVALAVRLAGPLDFTALERSLAEIVRRHEVLRTTFGWVDENPVQVIADGAMRDVQPLADLAVGQAIGRQARDLKFLRG